MVYQAGSRATVTSAVLAATLVTVAALAAADTGVSFVPARPVQTSQPKVPQTGGGWVQVSYMVQADGSVADVIALDSSGSSELEKVVVDTIATWKYEPARRNGQPVAQRMDDRLVVLKMTPNDKAANERLLEAFTTVEELLAAGKLEAAELLLVRTLDDKGLTYDAWGRIHLYLAKVEAGRGDKFRELQNLMIALPYGIWDPAGVLRRIFSLQVSLNMYRDALATYAVLKKLGSGAMNSELAGLALELRKLVDGTEGLRIDGEIRKRGSGNSISNWSHDLLRRRIAFANVNGYVDTFEVRCNSNIFSDKVDVEREWAVPDAWGPCIVLVFGQPGARFNLLELPPVTP